MSAAGLRAPLPPCTAKVRPERGVRRACTPCGPLFETINNCSRKIGGWEPPQSRVKGVPIWPARTHKKCWQARANGTTRRSLNRSHCGGALKSAQPATAGAGLRLVLGRPLHASLGGLGWPWGPLNEVIGHLPPAWVLHPPGVATCSVAARQAACLQVSPSALSALHLCSPAIGQSSCCPAGRSSALQH